ncbi:hypothetical protein A3Q56_01691 [Intoshia linei]|uniref:Katanin p60 ATPase-containing subunit A-like 2 n=1 Tax=Intoshia linei TaxID=1819745 RepID=A0A177BA62_9BILA|nr:hypothetical protein A3Q56_01691 [Intoshia linei]
MSVVNFSSKSESLTLQGIRSANEAREADQERLSSRKSNLLVLIYNYLVEEGYLSTADTFQNESKIIFSKFKICDNIDLETMLIDYESYYQIKFGKAPIFVKKMKNLSNQITKTIVQNKKKKKKKPNFVKTDENTSTYSTDIYTQGLSIHGSIIKDAKLLKPMNMLSGYSDEWKELAKIISRDIFLHSPETKWSSIIGLSQAQRLIKESVVYPITYPQLFTGILTPWKGLLLYGPPGTGKTMLAKAVATECKTTFFNVSASTIVSKWRGDSEKLIRVLFDLARFHAPSTIFLDEIDSLMCHRGSSGSHVEHEGSRRMKTELLIQLDGLSKTKDLVFLLAASNLPWELDQAMLRRLEKRIFVNLPTLDARQAMFESFLPQKSINTSGHNLISPNFDYETLAQKTEGYSGSDIHLLCKETAIRPVRKIFNALESTTSMNGPIDEIINPVSTQDALEALKNTTPSGLKFIKRYQSWSNDYQTI